MDTNQGGSVTSELHVHDWTPWHPLAVIEGVQWRRRICPGCASTQDEPVPAVLFGPVPESAIEAAARAQFEDQSPYNWDDAHLSEDIRETWRRDAAVGVAAAVPHIERAIRDKISGEILAEVKPLDYGLGHDRDAALILAARVACGGEATE